MNHQAAQAVRLRSRKMSPSLRSRLIHQLVQFLGNALRLNATASVAPRGRYFGSSHCFFHDPASARTRAAASKRGGERNHVAVLPSTTADYPLSRAKDAVALLALTINQVLRGQIDPRIANAVGYLVTVQLKALEQGETEERLATLEQPRIAGKTKEILKDLDDQVKSFGRSG